MFCLLHILYIHKHVSMWMCCACRMYYACICKNEMKLEKKIIHTWTHTTKTTQPLHTHRQIYNACLTPTTCNQFSKSPLILYYTSPRQWSNGWPTVSELETCYKAGWQTHSRMLLYSTSPWVGGDDQPISGGKGDKKLCWNMFWKKKKNFLHLTVHSFNVMRLFNSRCIIFWWQSFLFQSN